MTQLIKISENKTVSARDLHEYLNSQSDFTTWCKRMFEYGFIENVDYSLIKIGERSAHNKIDYALTLDCAKEIAMLQKSDKGKEARQYFIAVEKAALKPMTVEDMIIAQAQSVIELRKQTSLLEERILRIENAPVQNAELLYFSILGHCRNKGLQISLEQAKVYGVKCKAMCNQMGFVVGKISDPRFGSVNTYPLDVLNEIIK